MQNRIEYILFILLSFLFKLIGLTNARKFAKLMGAFFYYIIPIRKRTVYENLKIAFPNFDEKKINQVALGSYISFSVALVEILYMPWMTRRELENAVLFLNRDLILEKHKENKGVILLSAHFGNWEYIAASGGCQLNVPFSVIVKSQRNTLVDNWINKMRTRWTNKVIFLGVSIRYIYKEMLDKNIVAMVADQRGPREGIRVNFFGRPTAIYQGPAMLALKTGAPILYGIAVRQTDAIYKVEMVEIDRSNLPDDDSEKVIEISQRHMAHLEKLIREHPEQWLWHHKIWKY